MKGLVKRTISGKEISFYFGSYAFNLYEDYSGGMNILNFQEDYPKHPFKVGPNLLLAAANAHKVIVEDSEPTYSFKDACLWVDEIKITGVNELIEKGMQAPEVAESDSGEGKD